MNDTIIKGTGNSYRLKSVAAFLSLYPTYEDMATALIEGTLPVDFLINLPGIQQEGMALNTPNLLSGATGTKLGLTGDATPNDAFDALASRYGTCSTAAATKAKAVTLAGFRLATGAVIAVKFTYGNTAASPTLNVNGTGAKSIAIYGTTAAGSGAWSAGEVMLFTYDGTRWVMNSGAILGAGNGVEMYVGTYTGDGALDKSLTFPKRPFYLTIQMDVANDVTFASFVVDGAYFFSHSNNNQYNKIFINGTTVTLTQYGYSSTGGNLTVNTPDVKYEYMAFAPVSGAALV